MIKPFLLIGAAAFSFPALAQASAAPPAADEMTQSAPAPSDTAPAPDSTTAPPAEPAPSGNAATPTQVAQIVEQEFPTYDADASGELNAAEFSAWMKKLRTANDPAADTESESAKTWIAQAFAAADADKSTGVNKVELTSFLSRGA